MNTEKSNKKLYKIAIAFVILLIITVVLFIVFMLKSQSELASGAPNEESSATFATTNIIEDEHQGAKDKSGESGSAEDANREDGDAKDKAANENDNANAQIAEDVQASLDQVSASNPGVASAYFDISSNTIASANGDEAKVAASMIKLLVMAEFLTQAQNGNVSLEETYTVQASDIVGGTGSVQNGGAGATYGLAELATLMITVSDNTATNILIDKLGMNNINAQAGSLGLSGTSLNRYMMDSNAMASGVENYITANDAVKLLSAFYSGQKWSADLCNFAMQALYGQSISTSLWNVVPAGAAVGHKTGNLAGVLNDAGIVDCDHPYILVALCSGMDEGSSNGAMSEISEIGYNAYIG